MRYLTDRKRAAGLGSAKTGTAHLWAMKVSSVALLVLIPIFVLTFGRILGAPHADVVAYYAQPFPAIVAALTIFVGFMHFKDGARVMIEDYVHGFRRRALIIAVICVSYTAAASALYAIVKLAL